jgi:hypothetical protein
VSDEFDFRSVGGVLVARTDAHGDPKPVWDFGWVDDPTEVAAVSRRQPWATAAATPAGQVSADELPKEVFQWWAYKALFGRNPPEKNQKSVGSCVSFGTNTGVERGYAVDVKTSGGDSDQFKHFVEEITYGGSRVEVGGGRIRGDGSLGAWAAEFVKAGKWGLIARGVYENGKYDLTEYSESRCRQYGDRGVPDDLEDDAREHPVQAVVQVRSWIEAKKLLAQGYGIAICSDQGFSMRRDADGVAQPSGSWAHCMCLDGYVVLNSGKERGHIENSWGGNAHTGPVGPGDPSTAGFWADSGVIDRMLRQGDSWAFSGVKSFPAKKINWRRIL